MKKPYRLEFEFDAKGDDEDHCETIAEKVRGAIANLLEAYFGHVLVTVTPIPSKPNHLDVVTALAKAMPVNEESDRIVDEAFHRLVNKGTVESLTREADMGTSETNKPPCACLFTSTGEVKAVEPGCPTHHRAPEGVDVGREKCSTCGKGRDENEFCSNAFHVTTEVEKPDA